LGEVKRALEEGVRDDRGAAWMDGCNAVSDKLPIRRQVFQLLRSGRKGKQSHLIVPFE
jgi:hypothetical protein